MWEGFPLRPAGKSFGEIQPVIKKALRCKAEKREQRNGQNWRGKMRGAYNFLQSLKWGPFWQQAVEKPQNGATLELRGGRSRRGGRQRTRKQRRAAKEGERRKERDKEGKGRGGCRRQVLISNRLLVMRSLSHCAQIDVMWSTVAQGEACRGWQARMTSSLAFPGHTNTQARMENVRRRRNARTSAGKCPQTNKQGRNGSRRKYARTTQRTFNTPQHPAVNFLQASKRADTNIITPTHTL